MCIRDRSLREPIRARDAATKVYVDAKIIPKDTNSNQMCIRDSLMTMINAFSKYAYAVPLKTKKGIEVARALEPILRANIMKYLQTDNGKEYYNSTVEKLLSRYGVTLYSTYV